MGLFRGFERRDTAPLKVAEIAGCRGHHYTGKLVNAMPSPPTTSLPSLCPISLRH